MTRHRFEHAHESHRRLAPVRTWAVVLLALVAIAGGAGRARAQGGVWTSFPVPGIEVNSIAPADSGRVLIGTRFGGFVFDGIRWSKLPVFDPAGDSLSAQRVFQSSDRAIWIGTDAQGLYRLDVDGSVRRFTLADGLGNSSNDDIRAIAQSPDGRVWAGTAGGGLSVFNGVNWTTFTTDQGLPTMDVTALTVDPRDGSMWAGCLGQGGVSGLAHVVGGTITAYTSIPAPATSGNVFSVLVTSNGNVWIGFDHGIARLNGNVFEPVLAVSTPVRSMAEGPHGEIWCGSRTSGLGIYDHGVLSFSPNSPAGSSIESMFQSEAGVLWVATPGGVARFEGGAWLTYRSDAPLPTNALIVSVARDVSLEARGDSLDRSGISWFGMAPVGDPLNRVTLGRKANGRLSYLGSNGGLTPGTAWALDPAGHGEVWVGTGTASPPNGGVARVGASGQVSAVIDTSDGLPVAPVTSVRSVSNGVWIGTMGGVAFWNGASVRQLPVGPGRIPNSPVVDLDVDVAGRLWVATGGHPADANDARPSAGAVIFDPADSSYTRVTTADGLPSDSLLAVRVFTNGDVWIGTYKGLARWRDGAISVWTSAQGLPSNRINDVGELPGGLVCASTSAGLTIFDGEHFGTFTLPDGLASNQPARMWTDSLGVIAACGPDGMSFFHPDRMPPRARVLAGPPTVTGVAQPSFVVTGGDPETSARDLRLAYQFDGGPRTPFASDVTAITPAVPLADGDHVLRLWAKDRSLNESAEPFEVAFTVDATAPRPILVKPAFNDVVRGTVPVVASIADPRFARYTIEIRARGVVPWDTLLASTTLPSPPDTVFRWDTTHELDGNWELRVGVLDELGLQGYATVSVIVDNLAPNASVTSPATIDHVLGGRVFTTNGEAELYIPPNAWPSDQIVTIDPLVPADTLAANGWLAAWRIEAGDMTLDKRGTLTLKRPPSPLLDRGGTANVADVAPSRPMSVYRRLVDGTLVPIGGTFPPDGSSVTTTLDSLGSFVLVDGAGSGGGATAFSGVRGLDCQPRVVSPQGGGFDTRVAISFELGKPTSAAVKVFDRAGRLVKEVVENDNFPQGHNVVFWDGRDGDGDFVPSGLYMVAVRAEGETAVKTVAVANR